jgi:hypothetical protein
MTLGFHSQRFSENVKMMVQAKQPTITLKAADAVSLVHDIVALQSLIADLSQRLLDATGPVEVQLDGDKF